jgi:iron complex outermembrane receptor protein
MLNAYAAYTFNSPASAMTVFVRATNLLDEEARRHTSFVKNIAPLAGRSGLLGLRVTF